MNITQNELVEAIREAMLPLPGGVEDGVTVGDLCDRTGSCRPVVTRLLRALLKEGRAEHVKITRQRINGVAAKMDAYRLK